MMTFSRLGLRARLAIASARPQIESAWLEAPERLEDVLRTLAQDERIMGVAACAEDGAVLARTPDFPADVRADELVREARSAGPDDRFGHWSRVEHLSGGVSGG